MSKKEQIIGFPDGTFSPPFPPNQSFSKWCFQMTSFSFHPTHMWLYDFFSEKAKSSWRHAFPCAWPIIWEVAPQIVGIPPLQPLNHHPQEHHFLFGLCYASFSNIKFNFNFFPLIIQCCATSSNSVVEWDICHSSPHWSPPPLMLPCVQAKKETSNKIFSAQQLICGAVLSHSLKFYISVHSLLPGSKPR